MKMLKKMMNISKIVNNINHDEFFAYLENNSGRNIANLKKENYSLYCSLLTSQLSNLQQFGKGPEELKEYQTYTSKLEDFFNNYAKDILWLQLKSRKYPFLDSHINANKHKVAEDKDFCLFYIKYANIKPIEIKILVECIYPELSTSISNQFQRDFWTNLLIHQDLTKEFINRYLPLLQTPHFAFLLHKYQVEFFKLDPISINKVIKLTKLV